MQFDFLHIILSGIIILLLIIVFIVTLNVKNKNQIIEKRVNSIANKFEKDKSYLEKEIKRQQFIIDDYKHKNGAKRNIIENTPENSLVANTETIKNDEEEKPIVSTPYLSDDEEFKEKNKKLWDLSIAIHKEKDRIDKLKTEIEHRHNEVTKSINYAKRIQKALLPSSKILGIRFEDYFIYWKPKDIVSGDFYWFKRLEDHMVIAVADCTGHGVPGAFMSLLGISFFNDIFTKSNTLKSYQILEKLRDMLKLALQQELRDRSKATDGIDMALCIINNKTLEMDFAGANNPLYLVRDNQIKIFPAHRNPIGIHPSETAFKNHIFQLKKNDKIYMFSDGYIDQFGGEVGRKFLKRNFQRLLLYVAEKNLDMEQEKEVLEEAFEHWKGDHPQIDDILVMGIKI
jgi:serine phosphatase RsbU (regulator of sigma subunit)